MTYSPVLSERCCCVRRLDSNALVCDCEMMWLAHLLREKQDSTQAAATCQYPADMEGKPLANIADNDFHCCTFSILVMLASYNSSNVK